MPKAADSKYVSEQLYCNVYCKIKISRFSGWKTDSRGQYSIAYNLIDDSSLEAGLPLVLYSTTVSPRTGRTQAQAQAAHLTTPLSQVPASGSLTSAARQA